MGMEWSIMKAALRWCKVAFLTDGEGGFSPGVGWGVGIFEGDTILILNDYKDAERRSAEGDRKTLCSPPQRRNPFETYQRDVLETN